MATYTNRTDLTGLLVGDVITYDTATAINMAGCQVKVELYGKKYGSGSGNGGKTQFNLQTDQTYKYFYWTPEFGSSLIFDKTQSATSRTAYYRIGVAGDSGNGSTSAGGGTTGGNGAISTVGQNTYANGGSGGTQTSGGAGGSGYGSSYSYVSGSNGTAGSFGAGGNVNHGAGWYGGGTGATCAAGYSSSYIQDRAYGTGGGGSGFVIGKSTTTYPSGYMGDNNSDIVSLVAAVSNETLTQGGSTESAGKMVLTILSAAGPSLSSIAVTTMPTTTSYMTGDTFDPTGLVVTATYSDNSTDIVTQYCVLSSPDMSTAGTKTVTVSYTEGGITESTSFNITVTDAIVLTSISVETMPNKTVYNIGDTFGPTGLTIRKTYSNSNYSIISSGFTLSTPDMTTAGTKTITVSYTEDGVTQTTAFNITVIGGSPKYHIGYTDLSISNTNTFKFFSSFSNINSNHIYYSGDYGEDQYVLDTSTSTWSTKVWSRNVMGNHIWTDGTDTYYSSSSIQYVLDKSTSTWSNKTWTGLTSFYAYNTWTDGSYIYYSSGSNQYILNGSEWIPISWNGLNSFSGAYIWTDGDNIYYSYNNAQYVLDKSTSTWSTKTWNGLNLDDGQFIWTDGDNIYYSNYTTQYVLNKATSTWSSKTWNGLTDIRAYNIWTDGTDIYYSTKSSGQYVLDRSTSTWSSKTWNGLTSFGGEVIWTYPPVIEDGSVIGVYNGSEFVPAEVNYCTYVSNNTDLAGIYELSPDDPTYGTGTGHVGNVITIRPDGTFALTTASGSWDCEGTYTVSDSTVTLGNCDNANVAPVLNGATFGVTYDSTTGMPIITGTNPPSDAQYWLGIYIKDRNYVNFVKCNMYRCAGFDGNDNPIWEFIYTDI